MVVAGTYIWTVIEQWQSTGRQKHLYLHHQGEFQPNYYTFKSVNDSNHNGVVRIFVGLSCEPVAPAGAGLSGHCPGISAHYISRDLSKRTVRGHVYRVCRRDVHGTWPWTMEKSSQPRERRGTKRLQSFVFARVTTSLCRRFCCELWGLISYCIIVPRNVIMS